MSVTSGAPRTDTDAPLFGRAFDALSVGDAHRTAPRRVLQSEVDAFADLTGDHQPIHVDAEFAAAGPFGGRVAHGLLVVSVAVGLLPLEPARLLALRRVRETTFKRPVPSGAAITVGVAVDELRPMSDDAGLVGLRGDVRLAGGDRLAIRFGLEVLWSRVEPEAAVGRAVADGAGLAPGVAVPL